MSTCFEYEWFSRHMCKKFFNKTIVDVLDDCVVS